MYLVLHDENIWIIFKKYYTDFLFLHYSMTHQSDFHVEW